MYSIGSVDNSFTSFIHCIFSNVILLKGARLIFFLVKKWVDNGIGTDPLY